MRRLVPIVAAVTLLGLAAPSASAARPLSERSSFDVTDTIPAVACGYALRFRVTGTTTMKTFVDADGTAVRGLVSGPAKVTFTNLATDRWQTFAIPGPTFLGPGGELVRGTGPWFASDADGHPVIAAGNWVFVDGVPVGHGRVLDVCDALA